MSKFIPPKTSNPKKQKLLTEAEQKKLLTKLQLKYGAELQVIKEQIAQDMERYGFVQLETEIARDTLHNKIKQEEARYAVQG